LLKGDVSGNFKLRIFANSRSRRVLPPDFTSLSKGVSGFACNFVAHNILKKISPKILFHSAHAFLFFNENHPYRKSSVLSVKFVDGKAIPNS
jgi:hypothetical protein